MDLICYLCFSLPYYHVCFLQPGGHLLGMGRPLYSLVCGVFLCFVILFSCVLSLSHVVSWIKCDVDCIDS